jgi:hypothetical protein
MSQSSENCGVGVRNRFSNSACEVSVLVFSVFMLFLVSFGERVMERIAWRRSEGFGDDIVSPGGGRK